MMNRKQHTIVELNCPNKQGVFSVGYHGDLKNYKSDSKRSMGDFP